MDKNKILITSALPYANGALHLGHLAGAYLPADIYARFQRSMGKDVLFVCGSDEHGAAITMRAKKEGKTPNEIIDKYHNLNKQTFKDLGISFDFYHRTSEQLHHETAQDFFRTLLAKGDEFIEKTVEQYYDESYNAFLADRYIKGTCPKCGHEEAYGDQCENCGSTLSPTELIDPVSTLSGNKPILKETSHWYFRLDKHEDWLREWIGKGAFEGVQLHDPKSWRNHVTGQCMSWLDGGLQPRAITRDLDWGIKVPHENGEGKVLYVWFDAPIGYISATKQWALDNNKDWEEYWKGDDSQLVHFIGKDNIVFHCIVFPSMLKAHGDYNLPVNVPANQFLNFEGKKFSKSRGWGIEQHEYLETFKDFPNKEDALRYALLRNMPENKDADFKWDEFVDYHDKELADNLGNFMNRAIVLTNKYYEGVVPTPSAANNEVLDKANELVKKIATEIENYNFKFAIQAFMELSSHGNTYLQEVSPWKLFKAEPDSQVIKDCIYNCLQIAAQLGIASEMFIPFTSKKIRNMLNLPKKGENTMQQLLAHIDNKTAIIEAGHKIGEPELLFAKIHDRKDHSRLEIIEAQKSKLEAILEAEKEMDYKAPKESISFDDFTKLDIRTAKIIEAEKVKKAKKLLKLTVDLGFEKRTVVSGIAEYYEPEDILGREVALLINLEPRKIRGVESQGMILMAENAKGELSFVSPDKDWPSGFSIA